MSELSFDWAEILQWLLIISGISLVLAIIVGVWVWRRVQRLRLPDDATFVDAMQLTPFSVVLFLDLLDLGLDVFSAPISWVVLGRLGLTKLRGATVLEAFVPGTQFIPMMTASWILIRLFGPKLEEMPQIQEVINRGAQKRVDRRE